MRDPETEDEAQQARFRSFVKATTQADRDWGAFLTFEDAVTEAADEATLVNPYDEGELYHREQTMLREPLAQMLMEALPRVGLDAVVRNARGLGWALRFGVIGPRAGALKGIARASDLDDLANTGFETKEAHGEQVLQERMKRMEEQGRLK